MHLRTLGIVLVVIAALALGLRFAVVHFGWLPVSEQIVLKRATMVRVSYYAGPQYKSLTLKDPAEVRELLGSLRITDDGEERYIYSSSYSRVGGPASLPSIEFVFPNGQARHYTISGPQPYHLGERVVHEDFYRTLCSIVSRHEGKPVDVVSYPAKLKEIEPPDIKDFPPPPDK
jgi:hypothetical protein